MTLITICTDDLSALDITGFKPFIPEEYRYFFFDRPGAAPYRLLAYLSTLFHDQTLVEVGVHNGWGSLALSFNQSNRVVGYDTDLEPLSRDIRDSNPTLTFREGLPHKMDTGTILSSPFIHFDARHDGVYEEVFFDFLVAGSYKGLLMLDDIHLNKFMQRFWDGITLPKHDLTSWGHSTGTGLVCFGETFVKVVKTLHQP